MIYLRKVKSKNIGKQFLPASKLQYDVLAFAKPDDKEPIARWPWFYSSKPTKNHKTVMLNCHRYEVEWLTDIT